MTGVRGTGAQGGGAPQAPAGSGGDAPRAPAGPGPDSAGAGARPVGGGARRDSALPAPEAARAPDGASRPSGRDRLDPAARPFADALTAVFPDVGGAVTDAAEARRILAAAPRTPGGPVRVGAVEDRTVPGPPGAPPVPVRIYLPDPGERPGPRPTVVFSHGGGFVLCDLDTHDATARAFCREAGAAVVSVDYRRAPEHPFPAPLEDVHAVLCWAGEHIGELGGDPDALVVAGDSAGGTLSAAALLLAAERGGPPVALQVLVYPAVSAGLAFDSYRRNASGYYLTTAHLRWFWAQYLGAGGDPRDPLVSPLHAPAAALAALPPAHVVVAGCDPLHDDGLAWHRALLAHGVPSVLDSHPGMFHGFLALADHLPAAGAALQRIGGAISSTVAHGKSSGEPRGAAG